MLLWYLFISYYIKYDITHSSPISKAFYKPTRDEEKKDFEQHKIFRKYNCSDIFYHMDHTDIHDISFDPITMMHATHHMEMHHQHHPLLNMTRMFKCIHLKFKFMKNEKKTFGQISTVAISIITPITGMLTVMLSIAYSQFKGSKQIYNDIRGCFISITILLTAIKRTFNPTDSIQSTLESTFNSLEDIPNVIFKYLSKETSLSLDDNESKKYSSYNIETRMKMTIAYLYDISGHVTKDDISSVMILDELKDMKNEMINLFKLIFKLKELNHAMLLRNLYSIVAPGGLTIYILMIPIFWSIYGWTFGSVVILICAICFIGILEVIDRMNSVFNENNAMYEVIKVQTQETMTRMKDLFYDRSDNFDKLHTHHSSNPNEFLFKLTDHDHFQ